MRKVGVHDLFQIVCDHFCDLVQGLEILEWLSVFRYNIEDIEGNRVQVAYGYFV